MNNFPLISVVMCTYNGEKYLQEQLDSILNQTYPNLELIILDDGSFDNTINIIRNNYSNNNLKMTIVQNSQNLGVNKNMEKGFQLAKGEYICPSDQDDVWCENKIEVLYNLIKAKKVSLVFCNGYFVDSELNRTNRTELDANDFVEGKCFKELLLFNCVSGHGMLFNRKLLDGALPIPSSIIYYDHWMAFSGSLQDGLAFTKQCLLSFRRHDDAVTNVLLSKSEMKAYRIAVLKLFLDSKLLTNNKLLFAQRLYQYLSNNNTIRLIFILFINIQSIFRIRGKGLLSNLNHSIKFALLK